jgi:hypothetical protein
VRIEQITADGKTYDATSAVAGPLRLPPLVHDLEIDYTALSFVAPEKVLFRYKLEGWDRDWQEAGNRRQAFYTNLSPRNYRFRVRACNNSGVWNEAGAFLEFSVAPAYYQTTWFRLLCGVAFPALVGALYRLRLRQVARQFNMRLEEHVGERPRIVRELRYFAAKFPRAVAAFSNGFQPAPGTWGRNQTKTRQCYRSGRASDQRGPGCRTAVALVHGRDQRPCLSLNALGEELAAAESNRNTTAFSVEVAGPPRGTSIRLLPDEVYRIAGEALRLRVRDDGKERGTEGT